MVVIVGTGIDLCQIARIRGVLARHGDHFLSRICSDAESAQVHAAKDPAERLAGRWAVKEAAMKALGTGWGGGVTFRDITLLPTDGAPRLELTGAALATATALGATRWHASLSHDGGMAIAMVILEG